MKRMLLPLLFVPALLAQQAGSVSGEDHALIQQLLDRVKELEQALGVSLEAIVSAG